MKHDVSILHLFSGLGGAALGFQQAVQEFRGIAARFHTLAGIDVDGEACADFEALTGAPCHQLDLFTREDYTLFHGRPPGLEWREAQPEDLRRLTGGIAPDVIFTSPPCKGFSGLLPRESSESEKYQALNRLVTRGLFLSLEAWRDDLPALILMENVPRITSRGKPLLKDVKALLSSYGYVFSEGFHDCGELGGLAQHRRRYLMIARNPHKISQFIYQPPKERVRAIGEVLGPLPLPDDPAGGPLHRLPRLQWKTWVRLALIPAGGDWRDLQGQDFGSYQITAESNGQHTNKYRVQRWDSPAATVTGSDRVGSGAPAVADPRLLRNGSFGVIDWEQAIGTVAGESFPSNGAFSVADPRLPSTAGRHTSHYRVGAWDAPGGTVTGADHIANGALAVADPRLGCSPRSGAMRVIRWDEPASAVTGAGDVHSQGAACVADPRIPEETERGVWVIVSEDNTWHRPLTTLELAALQGFPLTMPDGRPLTLAGNSDGRWRERIGNAVPPPTARAIGETVLRGILAAREGVWLAGSDLIWVHPPEREMVS